MEQFGLVEFHEGACVVDGAFGIYVPQRTAQRLDLTAWGIEQAAIDTLLVGPGGDDEAYWWVWEEVLDSARLVEGNVQKELFQDQDVFILEICYSN